VRKKTRPVRKRSWNPGAVISPLAKRFLVSPSPSDTAEVYEEPAAHGDKTGPPIGPFPSGVESDEQKQEYDKLRRRVLWKMPYGLYVVGARDGERRNGMTLNW
jgi:hypothetical protein